MEKATVIFNPAAGQGRLEQQIDEIKEKLQGAFSEVSIYRTQESGDGRRYVKDLEGRTDAIIAAGGDGTVHEIAGAVCSLEKRPVFGVIPGGTCNDFSRAIGMSQNPLQAADQLSEKRVKSIEVGRADDRYFLNFWGIGLITQVSSNIDSNTKDSFGRLAYYISAAQNVRDHRSFHVKLESEDYTFDDDAVMVLIGNGPFTGGVRAFFPRVDMADGQLDVLIVKEASMHMIWSILRSKMTAAFPDNDENMIHFRTRKLTISTDPEQAIDCDGERKGKTPTTISAQPEHLKILAGDLSPSL